MSKMPLATKRRALELGATFIENDLDKMRQDAIRAQEVAGPHNSPTPLTTSAEGDLMKAAEWASAATWLRAMAEQEPRT